MTTDTGHNVTAPKPGDVLTVEQLEALPVGTEYDFIIRHRKGSTMPPQASRRVLVSLPTPPDMAPGSVVLDEDGDAWMRGSVRLWFAHPYREARWSNLAPRVVKVLHDAAVQS